MERKAISGWKAARREGFWCIFVFSFKRRIEVCRKMGRCSFFIENQSSSSKKVWVIFTLRAIESLFTTVPAACNLHPSAGVIIIKAVSPLLSNNGGSDILWGKSLIYISSSSASLQLTKIRIIYFILLQYNITDHIKACV